MLRLSVLSPGLAAVLTLLDAAPDGAGRGGRLGLVPPVLLLGVVGEVLVAFVLPPLDFGRRQAGSTSRGRAFDPATDLRLRLPQFARPGEERRPMRDLPFTHRIHTPEDPDGTTMILLHGTGGSETDLIEIPASWNIDDLPPMMFIKAAPNSHGFVSPHDVERMWLDQFDWVYREYDYAVFTMTIHPDVSGKPHVLLMHERIFAHISRNPGVKFCTFEEIARDFAKRSPRKK